MGKGLCYSIHNLQEHFMVLHNTYLLRTDHDNILIFPFFSIIHEDLFFSAGGGWVGDMYSTRCDIQASGNFLSLDISEMIMSTSR